MDNFGGRSAVRALGFGGCEVALAGDYTYVRTKQNVGHICISYVQRAILKGSCAVEKVSNAPFVDTGMSMGGGCGEA